MATRLEKAAELITVEKVDFFVNADPTKSNKYIIWMATQKKAGYTDEDIVGTVKAFDRRSKSLKHSDIYKYDDLKVLENEILSLKSSKAERKHLENLKLGTDYIPLIDDKAIKFYYILSMKGIRNLGKDTRWCIATSSSYWGSYNSSNNVFVVIDAKNEKNKFALLRRNSNDNYRLYNANDRSINLTASFSPVLVSRIKNQIDLILDIAGKNNKPTTSKKYLLSCPGEISSLPEIENLAKKVRDNALMSIMPFSKNEALITHLKKDIKDHLGKITFDKNYSVQFLKIFKSDLKDESFRDIIINTPLTQARFKEFEFVLKDLSKNEFKKLLNEIRFQQTKTCLIKLYSEYWRALGKDDITTPIANFLLKTHGEETLIKTFFLFGKVKVRSTYHRWRRTDGSFTRSVKKLILSESIMKKILANKDCPSKLTTFLNKKLNKKIFTKREHKKITDVLTIYTKNKSINVSAFKEYLSKISS